MEVVLVEPEIPQNTGSIARLCAATHTRLHLVGRLGFSLADRYLKRAGLDYWPEVDLRVHDSWEQFCASLGGARMLGFSARAFVPYTAVAYRPGDLLVFGSESSGLPQRAKRDLGGHLYRIPMSNPAVRSLNLANAVSIVLYEGIRQLSGAGRRGLRLAR